MRRSRRGGHGVLEFGGSGEDSFVAVVVTKLTGALLFILLLTMVIMALLPKAVDLPSSATAGGPDAAGWAGTGGQGAYRWSLDGDLPEGLAFDPDSAQVRGTPRAGTPRPASL